MSRSLVIEEERGTCSGFVHPHNGYYAGDFSTRPAQAASSSTRSHSGPATGATSIASPGLHLIASSRFVLASGRVQQDAPEPSAA